MARRELWGAFSNKSITLKPDDRFYDEPCWKSRAACYRGSVLLGPTCSTSAAVAGNCIILPANCIILPANIQPRFCGCTNLLPLTAASRSSMPGCPNEVGPVGLAPAKTTSRAGSEELSYSESFYPGKLKMKNNLISSLRTLNFRNYRNIPPRNTHLQNFLERGVVRQCSGSALFRLCPSHRF
jgi:hypothetical protein